MYELKIVIFKNVDPEKFFLFQQKNPYDTWSTRKYYGRSKKLVSTHVTT